MESIAFIKYKLKWITQYKLSYLLGTLLLSLFQVSCGIKFNIEATPPEELASDTSVVQLTIASPNGGTGFSTTTSSAIVSGTCSTNVTQLTTSLGSFFDSDCSDGTWMLSVYNLSAGLNTFTITGKDDLGNSHSDSIEITYDIIPPSLAVTGPNGGNNFTTGTQSQTVSGTCSTDAVNLTSSIGTFSDSNCSDGTWALNAYNLNSGLNTFTIDAEDALGNSTSDAIVINYDIIPPSLAITSPNSGNNFTTGAQSQTVSGTCSTDAINLSSSLGTFSDNDCSNGTWALNALNLSVGANTFTISAEDAIGNPVNDVVVITYSTAAPSLAITAPNGGVNFSTPTQSQTLSGTCSTDAINLSTNHGTFSDNDCSNGNWALNAYNLAAGANTFNIGAENNLGNPVTASIIITYDTTPPSLAITAPNSGNNLTTTTQSQTVSGTCSTDAINLATTLGTFADSNCSDGTWSLNAYNVAAGANTFTVSAEDLAGNDIDDTIVITFNTTSTVDKVYTSFSNWNDYIKNNDGGTNLYNQAGNACAGTEGGKYTSCIHVGEIRKVIAVGQSACTNLVAADQLGVFKWTCNSSTNPVVFYSTGFNSGKGLADLLLFDQFKTNKVTITRTTDSAVVVDTNSTTWWGNTVEALVDNSATSPVTLTGSGKIYTLDASRDTKGYNIDADNIAVVTLGSAILRLKAAAPDSCNDNGETSSPAYKTIICSGGQKFLWVEGRFNGNQVGGLGQVLYFGANGTKFSRFHNIYAYAGAYLGFATDQVSSSVFTNIRSSGNGYYGMSFYEDSYNVYQNLISTNNGDSGINIAYTANHNTFQKIMSSNNVGRGVDTYSSVNYNSITLMTTTNNANHGFEITGAAANRNTASGITSVNNNASGVITDSNNGYSTITQAVSANNATHGFYSLGANNNKWSHLVAYNNTNYAINVASGSTHNFASTILIGANGSNCNNAGTAVNLDASCNHGPGTASAPVTGINLQDTFVGQVTSDSVNTADVNGVETYANIGNDMDWFLFQSFFRAWGKYDVNVFPHNNHKSRCASGGTCQIWDWAIDPADTVLKNYNGTFTAGAACPASVNSNTAINNMTDGQGNTYLINAYEILFDAIGDEDGLCESSEACVFMPHLGADQGEGTLSSSTCTFATGGTVTGVLMYGY